MKTIAALGLSAVFAIGAAGAGRAVRSPSPVRVSGAWSRPEAAGLSMGVAYLTLVETGVHPDRLLGASSPVAAKVSLHRSEMSAGMMSMAAVDGGLPLAPGKPVRLAPGGYHLMLESLRQPLLAGRRYPLTLEFARAAPVTVDVEVRADTPAS